MRIKQNISLVTVKRDRNIKNCNRIYRERIKLLLRDQEGENINPNFSEFSESDRANSQLISKSPNRNVSTQFDPQETARFLYGIKLQKIDTLTNDQVIIGRKSRGRESGAGKEGKWISKQRRLPFESEPASTNKRKTCGNQQMQRAHCFFTPPPRGSLSCGATPPASGSSYGSRELAGGGDWWPAATASAIVVNRLWPVDATLSLDSSGSSILPNR